MSFLELNVIDIYVGLAIIASAGLAIINKKIDISGAIIGVLMAFIIWKGGGMVCLLSLFLFFIFGSIASSWKKGIKIKYKLEQENDGKRGISNVLANGGVALILAFISIANPIHQSVFVFMIISSFASASSDTFSSELGNIYGMKYFNIITLKRTERGYDGAISLAGLGFGVVGSFLIASVALLILKDLQFMIIITIVGLSGNLFDSILGATLQQKGYLNNHHVNFFATLSAALIALAIEII